MALYDLQGSGWDVGAYEWFSGAGFCPNLGGAITPPPNLPTITITIPTSNPTITVNTSTISIGGTTTPGGP